MIKTVVVGVVLVALGSVAYYYFSGASEHADVLPVGLAPVSYGKFVASVSAEGKIVARKSETLLSPITGTIHDDGVEVGSRVTRGSVIAYMTLDREDALRKRQDYKFAKMDLNVLKEQLAAARQLLKAKAESEQDFKALYIRMLKQEITVEDLHNDLLKRPITADLGGILIRKDFEEGDRFSQGASLCTVIDPSSVVVKIEVPQHLISDVKLGQRVEFTSDTFSDTLAGAVIEMPLAAQKSSSQQNEMFGGVEPKFPVVASITVASADPLIGSTVNAEFILAVHKGAFYIPADAILFHEGRPTVFTDKAGRALEQWVKLGLANSRFVEVLSGLNKSDTVVTVGNIDLTAGQRIENFRNEKSNPLSNH